MGESAAVWKSVGSRDGEAGAGDGFFYAEASHEPANKSSFAGANITNELNDTRAFFGKLFAEVKHFLFRCDFHCIIIA